VNDSDSTTATTHGVMASSWLAVRRIDPPHKTSRSVGVLIPVLLLEAAPTDNQGPSQLCGLSAITRNASSPRSFHSNIFLHNRLRRYDRFPTYTF
jgi:hypothetical protein